ncbi:MAG: tRNA 4-thiouridine(8) synthase ThiI [Candidatus Omnitrophota bacterium]
MGKYKAVGLLSGGLDSALAAKLLLDQGIEVHAVNISMPWGCGRPSRVIKLAEQLGMPFKSIPLGNDYLAVLKDPQYGFGVAHNPCVDCHIYMLRKAAEYMKEIGASFVFTGEVIGQRPMSQRRKCLDWVEEGSGIPGRVLRPLSAKLLPLTIPETEGIVDREKLMDLVGRNRRRQLDLAKELGLAGFSTPGGGCLLTEKVFGNRVKDVLARGCDAIHEMAILGMGRYFSLGDDAFILLGRDAQENEFLLEYALESDIIFRTYEFPSPTVVLRSKLVTERQLTLAAGLMQYFSKCAKSAPKLIPSWQKSSPETVRQILAVLPSEEELKVIWKM